MSKGKYRYKDPTHHQHQRQTIGRYQNRHHDKNKKNQPNNPSNQRDTNHASSSTHDVVFENYAQMMPSMEYQKEHDRTGYKKSHHTLNAGSLFFLIFTCCTLQAVATEVAHTQNITANLGDSLYKFGSHPRTNCYGFAIFSFMNWHKRHDPDTFTRMKGFIIDNGLFALPGGKNLEFNPNDVEKFPNLVENDILVFSNNKHVVNQRTINNLSDLKELKDPALVICSANTPNPKKACDTLGGKIETTYILPPPGRGHTGKNLETCVRQTNNGNECTHLNGDFHAGVYNNGTLYHTFPGGSSCGGGVRGEDISQKKPGDNKIAIPPVIEGCSKNFAVLSNCSALSLEPKEQGANHNEL